MRKIALFGPPRSGTSWLSLLFNSHPDVALRFQPLFSYGHKGALTPISTATEIADFFDAILHTSDPFALMQSSALKHYPAFPKSQQATHIAFKETRYLNVVRNLLATTKDVKVIGIIRNPLASLASWMGAPKEFHAEWDIFAEWRQAPSKNQGRPEEYFGFDQWKKAAADFLDFELYFTDRFRLIEYDQLNANPVGVMSDIFDFCGLDMHAQTLEFIKESQSRHDADPYSVFRVKAKDVVWQEVLPVAICEAVREDLEGTALDRFL